MSSVAQVVLKPRKFTPFLGDIHGCSIRRSRGWWGAPKTERPSICWPTAGSGSHGDLQPPSRIRVRLYTWNRGEPLDEGFWRIRLAAAIRLRQAVGYDDPRGASRLVYSEADGLSGLIVDRFAGHLVVQPTALATASRLPLFIATLIELLQPASIVVRTDATMARREGMELETGVVHGCLPEDSLWFEEHGIRYAVRLLAGQKTGFYLDQRENRSQAARYLRGRRLLDMCCYSGGFSLAASLLGGAADVVGVDASEAAVESARENARHNGATNVRFESGDCFRSLEQRAAAGERFGAVVLDPPKFTRSRYGVAEALRAYHRLNRLAVELLEPGGILVTCSCSGSVGREDFLDMLRGVANKTQRPLQVLEQRGAAPDHPLNLACPETDYLKCMICCVP